MPENEDYDTLILTQLATRESSCLTFATVASSSSLIILTLVIERELGPSYFWLNVIGIGFGLLGVLYRELTIFTVDLTEYRLLTLGFCAKLREARTATKWLRFTRMVRRVIPRFFLLMPLGAWLIFMWKLDAYLPSSALLFAVLLLVSILISLFDPATKNTGSK